MEESGKFIVEGRGDIMRRLDDDTAIHVLQYLDTAKDIASAAAVCCSWRRFGQCLSLPCLHFASHLFSWSSSR
jgi:hypothetical protein